MSGTVAAERECGGPRDTSIKQNTVCRIGTMTQEKCGEGGGKEGGRRKLGKETSERLNHGQASCSNRLKTLWLVSGMTHRCRREILPGCKSLARPKTI